MDALPRIIAIVQSEIGREVDLGAETLASDVRGWDSGVMVNVLFAFEEAFGLTLTSLEMERVRGVADLLGLLRNHGAGGRG